MTKKKAVKPRFRIQFDFDYQGHPGTEIEGESKTIPDMSLTVSQLLQNYARGIDGKLSEKNPLYFDITVPVINDLLDVEQFRDQLKEKLKETEQFIKNELEEKEKAEKLQADLNKKTGFVPPKQKEDGDPKEE
jgi:hypothetical protein